MRKLILLVLVMMMALGVGIASAQVGDVDPSGQTIVYWHQYNSGGQLDTINALVEEFNNTNEWGITVEAVSQGSYGDIRDLMNAAIISGETPNLVAGFPNDALSYALDGVVVDINTYLNDEMWGFSEEELASFNQGILNVGVAEDGTRLQWTNQVSANVFVVNMTMLNELGFDSPPATLDEFRDVACAAAALDGVNGYPLKGDSSEFESFVTSLGGSIFIDGEWNFTNEASLTVLQLYQDLFNEGCLYIPDSRFGNTDDFALGINPMAVTSSAGLPFIAAGFEESGVEADWIVTTTPWADDNRTVQVFTPGISILVSTPEKQLASWLFIKFLAESESVARWTENTSYFPINLDANPLLVDFEANNARFAEANALLSDPDINTYAGFQFASYGPVRGIVSEMIANVTTGGMDVLEAAQAAEEAAAEVRADLD
ncbi:MAG: extracellular solute-binding protein [Chloroflexi bacterium]|nr:MAG: extracellular solute-binding protein [Chloroflexota bacterium]